MGISNASGKWDGGGFGGQSGGPSGVYDSTLPTDAALPANEVKTPEAFETPKTSVPGGRSEESNEPAHTPKTIVVRVTLALKIPEDKFKDLVNSVNSVQDSVSGYGEVTVIEIVRNDVRDSPGL
jgi:hypothetical protein